MTEDEVYEQWKQQRGSLQTPSDFATQVIQRIAGSTSTPTRHRGVERLMTVAAVLAASIVGILRITMTLLIGIQAQ
jgi:hypothetical protein